MAITTAQAISLLENVLFESPDAAAANAPGWAAQAGATILTTATALENLPEASIAQQVIRYYQAALGRAPGAAEIQYYVAVAEQGLTPAQYAQGAAAVSQATWNIIASDFVNAPEFTQRYGTTFSPIAALYENVLHRAASATELSYYEGQIDFHGATTATLMQDFANSAEYLSKAGTLIKTSLADTGVVAATGGNPAAAFGTVTLHGTSSVGSVTEGSEFFVTFDTNLPSGTTLSYSVSGIPASSIPANANQFGPTGTFQIGNGSFTLGFDVSDAASQGFSGDMTLSISLPGYAGGTPLGQISIPLVETNTAVLTADPIKAVTGIPVDHNMLLVNYANPNAAAYTPLVSGFQTLGLGSASSGVFDLTGLAGAGASIEVTANLAAGNVTVTNAAAHQVLKYDASVTSNNTLTLQMSAAIDATADTSLTVDLTAGISATNYKPTDTLTFSGIFQAGDVVTWTIDGRTVSDKITSAESAADEASTMSTFMSDTIGQNSVYTVKTLAPGVVSFTGETWDDGMAASDNVTITGPGTGAATITHTVTTTSLNATGYKSLTVDTGIFFGSSYLQVSDTSLNHLVITGSGELSLSTPDAQISSIDATAYTGESIEFNSRFSPGGVTFQGGDHSITLTDTNLASGATFTYASGGQGLNLLTIGNTADPDNTANAMVTIGGFGQDIYLGTCGGSTNVTLVSGLNNVTLGDGMNQLTLTSGIGTDNITIAGVSHNGGYTVITGAQHFDRINLPVYATGKLEWASGTSPQITDQGSVAADLAVATSRVDGVNGVVSWFQSGGNTYIVENIGQASGTHSAGYAMVELVGLFQISSSALSGSSVVI